MLCVCSTWSHKRHSDCELLLDISSVWHLPLIDFVKQSEDQGSRYFLGWCQSTWLSLRQIWSVLVNQRPDYDSNPVYSLVFVICGTKTSGFCHLHRDPICFEMYCNIMVDHCGTPYMIFLHFDLILFCQSGSRSQILPGQWTVDSVKILFMDPHVVFSCHAFVPVQDVDQEKAHNILADRKVTTTNLPIFKHHYGWHNSSITYTLTTYNKAIGVSHQHWMLNMNLLDIYIHFSISDINHIHTNEILDILVNYTVDPYPCFARILVF